MCKWGDSNVNGELRVDTTTRVEKHGGKSDTNINIPLLVVIRVFAQNRFDFAHILWCEFKRCVVVVVFCVPVFVELITHGHAGRCDERP